MDATLRPSCSGSSSAELNTVTMWSFEKITPSAAATHRQQHIQAKLCKATEVHLQSVCITSTVLQKDFTENAEFWAPSVLFFPHAALPRPTTSP